MLGAVFSIEISNVMCIPASLRVSLFTGYLIADEFPAELAAGAAYVAGHDGEGRPILVTLVRNIPYLQVFLWLSHCEGFPESF